MRWLKEPLLHFLFAGLLLFGAGQWYRSHHAVQRIIVTSQRTEQLARRYALQFGAPPAPELRRSLVEDDVREEILYREGLRLGLDRDDEVVRRRVVQKAQFLLQDTAAPAEPGPLQLEAYFRQHGSRYAAPVRTSFSHVFVSVDAGEAAGRRRAVAILARLDPASARAPGAGDPFPDRYDFTAYDPQQTERLFGAGEFAAAVLQAPVGRWSGPYRSSYGWHLLFVTARVAARPLTLEEARDTVRADYLREAQEQANARALAELARRYTVVRQDR